MGWITVRPNQAPISAVWNLSKLKQLCKPQLYSSLKWDNTLKSTWLDASYGLWRLLSPPQSPHHWSYAIQTIPPCLDIIKTRTWRHGESAICQRVIITHWAGILTQVSGLQGQALTNTPHYAPRLSTGTLETFELFEHWDQPSPESPRNLYSGWGK